MNSSSLRLRSASLSCSTTSSSLRRRSSSCRSLSSASFSYFSRLSFCCYRYCSCAYLRCCFYLRFCSFTNCLREFRADPYPNPSSSSLSEFYHPSYSEFAFVSSCFSYGGGGASLAFSYLAWCICCCRFSLENLIL